MKKIAYLPIFLYCILSASIQAQSIVKGTITDDNQESLPFVTVALLKAQDSSVYKGAISDDGGIFNISEVAPGDYFLQIQHVGFNTEKIPAFTLKEGQQQLDLGAITLHENVTTLSGVTIKSSRPIVEQKIDRLVMNVENSIVTKGNMLIDLLDYTPSVQVDHEGNIKVNNKGTILILVDGKQMGTQSINEYLKNYPAENIVKLEVITNPSSRYDAKYSAVIEITTKNSLAYGFKGRFNVNYSQGVKERISPNVSLIYGSKKWSFNNTTTYYSSKYFATQSIKRSYPENTLTNNIQGTNFYKGLLTNTGVDFRPNKNHTLALRFNGNWSVPTSDINTRSTFSTFNPDQPDLLTSNMGNSRENSYDFNLQYLGKLNSSGHEIAVTLTQSLLYSQSDQFLNYYPLQNGDASETPNSNSMIIRDINQISTIGQIDYTIPLSPGNLELGAKLISVKNDNLLSQTNTDSDLISFDSLTDSQDIYQEQTMALYANQSVSIGENTNFRVGIRAEHTHQLLRQEDFEKDYFALFPSAIVTQNLANHHSLSISYKRGITRPSLSSLVPYRFIIDPYLYAESNPYLLPHFFHSVEAYANLGSITLTMNYVYNNNFISDVLLVDETSNVYVQKPYNLDRLQNFNTTVNWNKTIGNYWQMNNNVSMITTFTNSDIEQYRQIQMNNIGFRISSNQIVTINDTWTTNLSLDYLSPLQWGVWKSDHQFISSININKVLNEHVDLQLSVLDIFHSNRYKYNIQYGPIDIMSRGYNDDQRFKISLTYQFGKSSVTNNLRQGLENNEVKSRMGN